eukprot:1200-Heterococcus_DN1.PRE.1
MRGTTALMQHASHFDVPSVYAYTHEREPGRVNETQCSAHVVHTIAKQYGQTRDEEALSVAAAVK